jgi:hypothetical protein
MQLSRTRMRLKSGLPERMDIAVTYSNYKGWCTMSVSFAAQNLCGVGTESSQTLDAESQASLR